MFQSFAKATPSQLSVLLDFGQREATLFQWKVKVVIISPEIFY